MRLVQLLAPKNLFSRIAFLLTALSPRLLSLAGNYVNPPDEPAVLASGVASGMPSGSKISSSKVMLKHHAEKFKACLSGGGDVDLERFVAASTDFSRTLERFGDFAKPGLKDTAQNLRRVEQARSQGRVKSLRAFLADQIKSRGARLANGSPSRGSGAEALLWSRLGLKMWVEMFKDRLTRPQTSFAQTLRNGFSRSMGRYLDRFGRAAFDMASRQSPDWSEVRRSTLLGCDAQGRCSEESFTDELKSFVKQVEPVLDRMTELQRNAGLEDQRTP